MPNIYYLLAYTAEDKPGYTADLTILLAYIYNCFLYGEFIGGYVRSYIWTATLDFPTGGTYADLIVLLLYFYERISGTLNVILAKFLFV